MASLYKRRKKYWVSYVLGGKLVQKSLRTENERVARDKVKQIEYQLALGDLHQASKLPLVEFLESFCAHHRATRAPKTYKNDISRLRALFGPVCESLKIRPPGSPDSPRQGRPAVDKFAGRHIKAALLEDVTTEVLNRWLAARLTEEHWTAKTLNNYRQVLHKLFAHAIKHHGFVSRDKRYPNPAAGIDRQREPAPQIRFLNLTQIEEQLQALEERPVLRAMVAVCIYAGLRRSETVMLTRDDVDLAERLIRVRAKTVDGDSWQPKTRGNRVVPISDDLLAVLADYEPPRDIPWFFPSPKGKRWDPDNFSQDLRKANKAAGLPWNCAEFRHTFGSLLAQKGESLYKISTLMGNSPDICRRHYAALIPEQMRDVVEFGRPATSSPPVESNAGAEDLMRQLRELLKGQEQKEDDGDEPKIRLVR